LGDIYPRAFPERATGRAEFEKTFKTMFEQIRGSKTSAPYMDIQPREMKIQLFGNLAISQRFISMIRPDLSTTLHAES
jgi:hypothetical protein